MRTGGASTAHYRETLADLRSKLAEADKKAAKLRRMIEDILEVYEDPIVSGGGGVVDEAAEPKVSESYNKAVTQGSFVTDIAAIDNRLDGLGLGDACLLAISEMGGRATNHEIFKFLASHGYKSKSANPMNNIGTALNHRSRAKGDIIRDGRYWSVHTKKVEETKENVNGDSF